jgi:small redox-active disulfide protein 2
MTKIEVLGPGCYNCHLVEQAAREAIAMAGIQAEIVKITDWGQIASYGILHTPGLVIDGKVVSAGRIPAATEIVAWLAAEAARA